MTNFAVSKSFWQRVLDKLKNLTTRVSILESGGGGGSGIVETISAGNNIAVNLSDPVNPEVATLNTYPIYLEATHGITDLVIYGTTTDINIVMIGCTFDYNNGEVIGTCDYDTINSVMTNLNVPFNSGAESGGVRWANAEDGPAWYEILQGIAGVTILNTVVEYSASPLLYTYSAGSHVIINSYFCPAYNVTIPTGGGGGNEFYISNFHVLTCRTITIPGGLFNSGVALQGTVTDYDSDVIIPPITLTVGATSFDIRDTDTFAGVYWLIPHAAGNLITDIISSNQSGRKYYMTTYATSSYVSYGAGLGIYINSGITDPVVIPGTSGRDFSGRVLLISDNDDAFLLPSYQYYA